MSRVARPAPPRPPLSRTPAKPPRPLDMRPTRWQLLRRRKRWLLRPVAWSVAAVLLAAGGLHMARSVSAGGNVATLQDRLGSAFRFTVADVIVEGREKTPEPMLRAALGVSPGDRLLGFSLDGARTRI